MRTFCFVVSALLLFSPFAPSQTNESEPAAKESASAYQRATLVKMTARVRTDTQETRHTTVNDTTLITEKIVTYWFTIRSGGVQYSSKYTPDKQPGDMPDAWWHGNAPVEIGIRKRTLFIKSPKGEVVASRIVSQKQLPN